MNLNAKHPDRPGFRPLYQQVQELLRARISSGAWRPAEALPSEQSLASELGVSQGTVRKALDSLAADRLVERRQGKGTYVAQHTNETALFRFLKIFDGTGAQVSPATLQTTLKTRVATAQERKALALTAKAKVHELSRKRLVGSHPALLETICVPQTLFPDLASRQPLPNTLYTLYEADYGVTIVGAEEKITAVAARASDAAALKVGAAAPLLEVERIAVDINGRPVEYRRSRFSTERYHYRAELG